MAHASRRPGTLAVLRHGALDLVSAAAFLGIWLMRERFEYDTLRSLLFWPVVFEAMVAVALFLAGLAASFEHAAARVGWLAFFAMLYLGGAWLLGVTAEMPQAWLIALWLLVARAIPPRGEQFASRGHFQWLHDGAGVSGLLWSAGFVITVVLMITVPAPVIVSTDGEPVGQTPAWIFPLAWAPYFVAEAIARAWRTLRRTA